MSHSFYNVWIHAVFTTKDRQPIINADLEDFLFPFLYDEFRDLGCQLKIVNGLSDHVHCLFLLDAQQSIAHVIKQIKGGSSHCINQNNIIFEKFAWQKGYAAFSVSDSGVDAVYQYIKNQKLNDESLEQEGIYMLS
jgi:putative transposase